MGQAVVTRGYRRLGRPGGFWSRERIEAIRWAATHGVERGVGRGPERRGRILDRLWFRDLRPESVVEEFRRLGPRGIDRLDVDVGVVFAGVRLRLPIYIGDMSFGALAGNPNIAVARAATEYGVVAGVGEGGLHPVVARYRNIVVQWASGRFGVDADMLRRGLAVNIKIGQGAKPGIGGHLPGSKVVGLIARVRKLPEGAEAISPAPHHDIYSIEDLAQRVRMLQELTGKPILVKVAAVNHVGYVAVGVARSGAAGVIIDGAGAGTGATPRIVRDHAGIPVDYAVPVADRLLHENGLRDGFLVIGGGMLSSGEDVVKLTMLGADMAMMSTAVLVAMGCVMCHQCSRGVCPAALTTSIDSGRVLDIDWAVERVKTFLRAVERTVKLYTYLLGEDSISKLRGRRDMLVAYSVDERVASILGVEVAEPGEIAWYGDPGGEAIEREVYEKASTPVIGMGGYVPGYTVPARRPLDLLRVEAAQVTRPPIDPYREGIDVSITLPDGTRLEAPIGVTCTDSALVAAAEALGYPVECLLAEEPTAVVEPGAYPPMDARRVVVAEEAPEPVNGVWLEEWIVRLDDEYWAQRVRGNTLLAASGMFRHGADVYKLLALGADIVIPREFFARLAEKLEGLDYALRRERYENALVALTWELKLLMGAGGVTTVTALTGNRELLRSLDGRVAGMLHVKTAGE